MEKPLKNTISLLEEMIAYETLWAMPNQTFKTMAQLFSNNKMLPSELLEKCSSEQLFDELEDLSIRVRDYVKRFNGFSVCVNGTFQYPERLRQAKYPIELFYYKGDISLVESPCISVVGTRKCSDEGKSRARKLARGLVEAGYTVVSGLAHGIDTEAMSEAVDSNGATIGVIGTPINEYYPKTNKAFQDFIAKHQLLISQVPFYKYSNAHYTINRLYFLERNETMAALSEATVIVEASDTSGTHRQARACFEQGRKLFILNSCFENRSISWPQKYQKRGAIRVNALDDILLALKNT